MPDCNRYTYLGFSVEAFYHAGTGTWSYLLMEEASGACAVIDPVLDFDRTTGQVSTAAVETVAEVIQWRGGRLQWVLETRVHADHLSGAQALRDRLGGLTAPFSSCARFDALPQEGDALQIGDITLAALHTPGHTSHCLTYGVNHEAGTLLFVGDTLLPPAIGTARCDFPGGSAEALYASVGRILSFPAATEVFVCHDYPATGVPPSCRSTVQDHCTHNIHWRDRPSASAFVAYRQERDRSLALPALFEPSLRFNLGLPPPLPITNVFPNSQPRFQGAHHH